MKAHQALVSEMPLKAVVRDYPGAVVLGGLLTWMLSAAIVVVILLTPALLQKVYSVPADVALRANSFASALGRRYISRIIPTKVGITSIPPLPSRMKF